MNHLKNLAVIVSEAIKKPNATTRHLREYPVSDKDVAKPVKPEKKEKRQNVAEAVPYSYGFVKPPRKGSVAYNAIMKRKEQDKNRVKEIEAIGTKNHHVGVAKVTKEQIEDVTETYKYIDQSGGQVIKGKSGTFVGYTHSATKGKGANILKHNKTGKYYAAGGSSTAFTAKTTLHDTPEDAAKAYHKGNLAEDINNEAYMGKVTIASNPREKWMKSVKDRGYDMRAGAKRLQDLLDKQKKERAEMEQRAKEKGLEY